MIRIYEKKLNSDIQVAISGDESDNVDIQDIVYRLQLLGYVTSFENSFSTPKNGRISFVYVFNNKVASLKFRSDYTKIKLKIQNEKKWRQKI